MRPCACNGRAALLHRELVTSGRLPCVPRFSPVGPPNTALRRTRPRTLPGRSFVASSPAAPSNAVLGGLVLRACQLRTPDPASTTTVASCPRAVRARRLAPSARAPLRAASVRFTPTRPPRSLLAALRSWPALPTPSPPSAGRPAAAARPHATLPFRVSRLSRRTSLRRRR
jgi:hypothetical protein